MNDMDGMRAAEASPDVEELARRCAGILIKEGQYEVLHRNVLVVHALGPVLCLHKDLAQASCDIDLTGLAPGPRHLRTKVELTLELVAEGRYVHLHPFEQTWYEPIILREQCQEQVLPVHLHVTKANCDSVGGL